ncbi:metal ABC transporter solute-binding protein, Zn/Mn family [Cerasicoccus maritimus]|uniref:metal ABC transporter solute-binding protein, Zn/Mn family n=1 Tax=Cerasicoccus maritimus TaxID=490089 RepID=UPI002852B495|nr:zinc ABC transporter substrate-binding protein [Cerasicoccus maritimus]
MKKTLLYFSALCAAFFSQTATAAPKSYPYKVVTTVGMITDIVHNVAGDKAVVDGLIGEGIDPHLYKPTRKDLIALKGADIIFYNGLMLEGKMTDVLVKLASRKPIFAVTEGIEEQEGYVLSDESQHYDPHVWMDVQGWIAATAVVAESLSEYDPKNAAYYEKNAAAYIQQLRKLDAYASEVLATIPEQQRYLVTAHDAFNYLGRAYGIEVKGIQGLSTESEAGVRDIELLVDFLVANQIPAVFVETSVSDKNVRALIEGAEAKGHKLEIGGSLFSDAMGTTGTYEGTYIGMIDHNATTIANALGGQAPAQGLNGKLTPSD